MPKAYIKTENFKHKATVYETGPDASLGNQLEFKTKRKIGALWCAFPDDIQFYRFDVRAEDRGKTIVFCKRNVLFQADGFRKILLEFSSTFITGLFVIQELRMYGDAYFRLEIKTA